MLSRWTRAAPAAAARCPLGTHGALRVRRVVVPSAGGASGQGDIEGPCPPRAFPSSFGRRWRSSVTGSSKSAPPPTPPTWTHTDKTRSLLLDPDNPITNPERYRLHKVPAATRDRDGAFEELSEKERGWESSPYLRMLTSPLRRCRWSNKVMPRDFFIPLKSATYTVSSAPKPIPLSSKSPPAPSEDRDKDGGSTAQEGHVFTRRCSAIFPRELLHPNSYTIDDLRGHKDGRGYIICRKSAVSDFGKKGFKRLDNAAEMNPFLLLQIESQLRRRIVQELEILAKRSKGRDSLTETFKSLPMKAHEQVVRDGHLIKEDGSTPLAALLLLSDDTPLPGQSHSTTHADLTRFSALIPHIDSIEHLKHLNLPIHRIPCYSIPALFATGGEGSKKRAVDSGNAESAKPINDNRSRSSEDKTRLSGESSQSQGAPSKQRPVGESEKRATSPAAPKQQPKEPAPLPLIENYEMLEKLRPELLERETREAQELFQESRRYLARLVGDSASGPGGEENKRSPPQVITVKAGCHHAVPLLIALWRWRMWCGEGWTETGFGLMEATRSEPTRSV